MRLSLLIVLTVVASVATGQPGQEQTPTEHWVNPGVGPGAPKDLNKLVSATDAIFVGRLDGISVEFIDSRQELLFTRLTFRPTEWIKPSGYPITGQTVNVLTRGGTYAEVDGRRVGRKPAEIAQRLQIGANYVVLVTLERRPGLPWSGTYGLIGLDAVVRLTERDFIAADAHSKWPDAILQQAHTVLPAPAEFPSRRELLLATLRAAVAKKQ